MNSLKNKFTILISGSTGTGKTEAALQLGKHFPIEIINADIGSFYQNMTIGTAKPNWKQEVVPHHFFDVITNPTSWTAPQFRDKLKNLIQEVWSRGNIPVVVGGSAFYIQSFFYQHYDQMDVPDDLYASLESYSAQELWEQLEAIDPIRAQQLEKNDKYRLVRALAIWHVSKIKPSTCTMNFDPLSSFLFITIQRDRMQLYDKINKRTHVMLQDGWIEEVQQIIQDETWKKFILKKKMIGYDSVIAYLQSLQSKEDYEQLVATIQKRTRNYAKRQVTFLKKLNKMVESEAKKHPKLIGKNIEWNLTLCDLGLYIKQLSEEVSQILE